MGRALPSCLLVAFAALLACSAENRDSESSADDELREEPVEIFEGVVSRHSDGDTLRVKRADTGADTRIRFVGIDTPEKERKEFPGIDQEPWASRASTALRELLPLGATIRIASFGPDPVGRVLGRVEGTGDAPSANETMVRRGFALPLVFCGSGSSCSERELTDGYSGRLRRACEVALAEELGVFARPALDEAPYEFRTRAWGSHETDWVGDAVSREYVAYADRAKVPRCSQVVFLTGTEPERYGFRRASP